MFKANVQKIQKNIETLREILESQKPIKEQIKEFQRTTGLKRRSFFLYKKYILGKTKTLNFSYKPKLESNECYFCLSKENLLTHHINHIRKDNKKGNLITLCASCHRKIHLIIRKLVQK